MTYQLRSHTITFEAALRDLESQSVQARTMAAHALGDVPDPDDRARAVQALSLALDDDSPEVRSQAALSLGALETESAVELLAARIDDEVPLVRQSALVALGRLGFASGFDAVAHALESGPPDVRFQAATALAEIDQACGPAQARAGAYLIRALEDEDHEVVGAAAVALGELGARSAIEPLVRLLDTERDPLTRFDVAYALADLGDERAIDALIEFTDEPDLAWDALEALDRLGSARAAAPLAALLHKRSTAAPIQLRAAATILAVANARTESSSATQEILVSPEMIDAARACLLAGLRARKLDYRGLAVQLLGAVGGDWALNDMRALRTRRAGRRHAEEIDLALHRIADRVDRPTAHDSGESD